MSRAFFSNMAHQKWSTKLQWRGVVFRVAANGQTELRLSSQRHDGLAPLTRA